MAGAMLDVTLDTSQIGSALEELARRLGDLTTPFNDIGEYLHQSTDERFQRKVAPDGSPWAPLSAVTLARKKGTAILREKGTLQDTLRKQVTSTELAFGTDRPYGAVHQFGQKKGASGSSKGRPIPWGDIPARPYLGLSSDDETEVVLTIHDYLMEPIKG
ncbi:phage virion morphogenesis protein [Pseudomonas sp. GM60]|uniref:phage virion morphogenesis protein n=1 Tax=Pseudomonas sp. GM60 TaxID=1144334 RepID=UPI000270AE2D|nr:phage virion morphogenesis protein [Pseudomonas sp. GM60]EJM77252.1 phage virion morphogenesis protein, putative tail completion [Pseudomonas sp. GM60]